MRASTVPSIRLSERYPYTLETLIDEALSSHPGLASKKEKLKLSRNRVPQAGALQDPMLQNTFWSIHDNALQTAGGRVGHQVGLSQKIPWPSKLWTREIIAEEEVRIAEAQVVEMERAIVESVHLAYYELWLAGQLIEVFEEDKEVADELVAVSKSRYIAGGSQQDVLRAEIEKVKLENQLISLRLQKEEALADLGTLIRKPTKRVAISYVEPIVNEDEPVLDSLIANADRCNPKLNELAAAQDRDRAKESLAELENFPDFQFDAGYSFVSDNSSVLSPVANGRDNFSLTVGVTLPIWRSRIESSIRESIHQSSSTQLLRESEMDRIRGQLRRQVATVIAATANLKLLRERLIPRTKQTLAVSVAGYVGEKVDFASLVEIYEELLTFQAQSARAKVAQASAIARINRMAGCNRHEYD